VHNAALRGDGQVVCWGDNSSGACSVPSDIGRVAKIVAGYGYTAALTVQESCPFDMDGDGAVGGSDIALVLLDFGPCQ
jgi:alpha-tubulin suppressor-like RCC1 family protein